MNKEYWLLIALFFLIVSCSEHEKRIQKKDTIQPEELVLLISDIHLADAILAMPTYLRRIPGKDSLSNYQDIFDKHGSTLEQFETTLQYYSDHPLEFELIYEKVVNNLSKLDSEIKSQRFENQDPDEPENLWEERPEWKFPEDGSQIKMPFSIPAERMGFYFIRARIKMYNDDESVKPKVIAYFWYDDGTEEGKIIYFPESRIPKNDEWQYHSISLKASDPKITHLKGFLLSNDTLSGDWSKHVDIENISIRFKKLPGS